MGLGVISGRSEGVNVVKIHYMYEILKKLTNYVFPNGVEGWLDMIKTYCLRFS